MCAGFLFADTVHFHSLQGRAKPIWLMHVQKFIHHKHSDMKVYSQLVKNQMHIMNTESPSFQWCKNNEFDLDFYWRPWPWPTVTNTGIVRCTVVVMQSEKLLQLCFPIFPTTQLTLTLDKVLAKEYNLVNFRESSHDNVRENITLT